MTIQITDELETIRCPECGVHYAMPRALLDLRRKDGRWFCCPVGHQQHYQKPQLTIARASANLKQEIER